MGVQHILSRRFWSSIFSLLFVAFLWGCDRPRERADLVFVNGAEPETLDPALLTGQPEMRIVRALFEGLVNLDTRGKLIPGVAASWEISADQRVFTFSLRSDARWSDGRAVTANDFVHSWKRVLEPQTGSAYQYLLYCIQNAQAYAEGKISDFGEVGVRALARDILEVQLEKPAPYFLDFCTVPVFLPVPVSLIESIGDAWIKPEHIVTNGPYLLESWRINDSIRLRKNPDYWNARAVALETVDALAISKANVAFNFYESGQADLLLDKGSIPPALVDTLKQRSDFHSAPFLATYFLRFNCTRPPFNDARVRQALSLAIDKKRITKKITRAGERPADALVPPGIEGYESPRGLGYDPVRARALLAAAGYPGGKRFPLVHYLYSESELNEAIAIELQSMWYEALGIRVDLARQEWKVYLNSMDQLDYGICRSSWVGDFLDPTTFLDLFTSTSGNNRTGWRSDAYDRVLQAASNEGLKHARYGLLSKAERILVESEAPVCPLFFYVGTQLYDPNKWVGIHSNLLDEHPLNAIRPR